MQQAGWKIGLRFDPVLYHGEFERIYKEMFQAIFSSIDANTVHSVSLGGFRLPEAFFKTMTKLYPYEELFAGALDKTQDKMVAYQPDLEQAMLAYCEEIILEYISRDRYFPCTG